MPTVKVNDRRVSYHVLGHGVPIVFVPPPVVGRSAFYRQVQHLSSRYRLILLDLPGHGGSSPTDRPLVYEDLVNDIKMVLDHLAISKAVVCGYSMGGSVVFEFMRRYADRVLGGLAVSGLVDASDWLVQLQLAAAASMARANAITALAVALSAANADNTMSFKYMCQAGRNVSAYDVATMFEYARCFDCTRDLPHLEAPFQWIVGRQDNRLYPHARAIEDKLPRHSLVVIPNARHQIPTKQFRELNQVIVSFMTDIGSSRQARDLGTQYV